MPCGDGPVTPHVVVEPERICNVEGHDHCGKVMNWGNLLVCENCGHRIGWHPGG